MVRAVVEAAPWKGKEIMHREQPPSILMIFSDDPGSLKTLATLLAPHCNRWQQASPAAVFESAPPDVDCPFVLVTDLPADYAATVRTHWPLGDVAGWRALCAATAPTTARRPAGASGASGGQLKAAGSAAPRIVVLAGEEHT